MDELQGMNVSGTSGTQPENAGTQMPGMDYAADMAGMMNPAAAFPQTAASAPAASAPAAPAAAAAPAPAAAAQAPGFTPEEQAQIHLFADRIDIRDTKTIIEFGSGVQKQMSDFSESVLQSVKTHDLGEVGSLLTGVMSNLRDFNPGAQEEEKGGLFGLFKKPAKKLGDMKAEYDKASVNVDKVAQALQTHQIRLLKDVDMLDQMYASNLAYYKNLSMYIAAGQEKIRRAREVDLPALKAKAEASGLPEDAQEAKDFEDQIGRFEKKIHDLELTRMVALQTAPQIRMIQSNDSTMVEKIQSTIVNTIPLWKNQMVLALGLEDSNQAAKAENEVTEMTNKLLLSNAEKLKQTTIATAKASERGIVDIETLRNTNASLISTLDEVARIQEEGRRARAAAETELRNMEDELRRKLLTMQPTQAVPADVAPAPEIASGPAAPFSEADPLRAPWEK